MSIKKGMGIKIEISDFIYANNCVFNFFHNLHQNTHQQGLSHLRFLR
jgi:hypothetical protein